MELTRENGTLTLKLSGRLDANTSAEVIECARSEKFEHMEICMELLEYISSAGLRALLACKQAADACGGTLVVKKPQPAVLDIMVISGFKKMLNIQE